MGGRPWHYDLPGQNIYASNTAERLATARQPTEQKACSPGRRCCDRSPGTSTTCLLVFSSSIGVRQSSQRGRPAVATQATACSESTISPGARMRVATATRPLPLPPWTTVYGTAAIVCGTAATVCCMYLLENHRRRANRGEFCATEAEVAALAACRLLSSIVST